MNMLRISPVGAMDIRQGCSKTALGPKGRLTLQEPLLHNSQKHEPCRVVARSRLSVLAEADFTVLDKCETVYPSRSSWR